MCIYDNPPTVCTAACSHVQSPSEDSAHQLPANLLALQLMMEQQAPALLCISEQMQHLKDSIKSVRSDMVALRLMPKIASTLPKNDTIAQAPLTMNAGQLVAFLSAGDGVPHRRALKLASDLPTPLYKHQTFRYNSRSIEMKLVGLGNEPEEAKEALVMCARLFKATYPEEELHNDTFCILAGATSVCIEPGSRLMFHDLSFTEVTSNFDPSWIYLAVECVNQRDIRPLVIEGIRVKSRAPKTQEATNE